MFAQLQARARSTFDVPKVWWSLLARLVGPVLVVVRLGKPHVPGAPGLASKVELRAFSWAGAASRRLTLSTEPKANRVNELLGLLGVQEKT